jgi:hypothetical protein
VAVRQFTEPQDGAGAHLESHPEPGVTSVGVLTLLSGIAVRKIPHELIDLERLRLYHLTIQARWRSGNAGKGRRREQISQRNPFHR